MQQKIASYVSKMRGASRIKRQLRAGHRTEYEVKVLWYRGERSFFSSLGNPGHAWAPEISRVEESEKSGIAGGENHTAELNARRKEQTSVTWQNGKSGREKLTSTSMQVRNKTTQRNKTNTEDETHSFPAFMPSCIVPNM